MNLAHTQGTPGMKGSARRATLVALIAGGFHLVHREAGEGSPPAGRRKWSEAR
jgi:hypothetical protein